MTKHPQNSHINQYSSPCIASFVQAVEQPQQFADDADIGAADIGATRFKNMLTKHN